MILIFDINNRTPSENAGFTRGFFVAVLSSLSTKIAIIIAENAKIVFN